MWNCGGYERVEILEHLDGIVDIDMPDVKWADDQAAALDSKEPGYWTNLQDSLREMHRPVDELRVEGPLATGGLLLRHLDMPGHVECGKRVLEFVAGELSRDTYVNLMAQYRSPYKANSEAFYAEIGRRITREEYDELVAYGRDHGLRRLLVDHRHLAICAR